MTAKSRTAKYYQSHPEGRSVHRSYQKERNKKPSEVKYRVELNRINKTKGKIGDHKDISHTKSGKTVLESQSKNRARQGANGKSTKK